MSEFLDRLRQSSAYFGANAPFIEDLFESYLTDPASVPDNWRRHFDSLPPVNGSPVNDQSHRHVQEDFLRLATDPSSRTPCAAGLSAVAAERQAKVLRLINAYRVRGHQNARLDPLNLKPQLPLPDLQPSYYGLGKDDMDMVFNTGSLFAPDQLPLKDILALVQETYTGNVGSEYMHITNTEEKRWIQQRVESYRVRPELDDAQRRWILQMLTAAEGIEKFMHARYVGQKRFSLEGGECLIPMLDESIQRAGRDGCKEVVIGMAHRGRLNVLANIIGKPPAQIFGEFEGKRHVTDEGILSSGDVKYHKGFSSDVETPGGLVHITLGFNPSHLEIIGPVVQGSVRARQQRRRDRSGEKVLPIILHGDAAFAGQGVNMEMFNMSQARGYTVGGTLHIVINNQIGFTTSNTLDSRSTTYCTDVAKVVQAPIFHVNGDDPEAVIFVTRLALDYRNRFRKDVVIDLVCYRRHGHNEADEPAVTQPMMYQKIRNHQPTRAKYADELIASQLITPAEAQGYVEDIRAEFERGNCVGRPSVCLVNNVYHVDWSKYRGVRWNHPVDTTFDADRFEALAGQIVTPPGDFNLHPRVQRIMDDRRLMAQGDKLIDWGFAENMAYATLLDQGVPIRISGQDCRRGTFFHRHAMLRNQDTGASYIPLRHLHKGQPNFTVIDSVLSEEAVLAYEYGYATADPKALTIWEAQFGDFANGAQVVIDQFITSAGAKWGLYCGLVMLLPHGYEGQGPEHSSARLERYMQLCAEHNIQVCSPTTPAQIFHLLRRQMLRPFRHPLVVMSPKSLLRHPLATSSLDSLTHGRFEPVIDEVDPIDANGVTQVVLCTGKVYYDLLQARRTRELNHVALVRVEQLYPFPRDDFDAIVARYPKAGLFVWCQEEPQNQGAWDQIKHRFHILQDGKRELIYAGRPSAAAPATGYHQVHQEEQEKLVDDALTGRCDPSMNRRG
ncbi:MAG TPA: 2-oxoglutarate dehydrogenase E1 component [Gammaproteobacteria bacterium]|nr:2-oxoglutarate dehydrogenase E1 component [Gammaproteobacteria bacterium]MCP5438986.1 2-oxoglutarate dehydrogenase E1 component [Chromatiaceae bacterium]MCW5585980.1 2-oxoglutarate dehydrogenase E1 component [Chromatiales bacterium]HPQ24837.1 2-oxoglutarate dehydrogenase E1 component [Gammaproteobacteria bacterium]